MSIIKVKSRGTDSVSGRRNLMINGSMQIAQRGTSSTNSGYGTCDKWKHTYSTDQYAATQAQVTDVPTGNGFTRSLRYTVTTPETSLDGTNYVAMTQFIEAANLQHLCYGTSSAKTTTLSFWVKSSVTGTYGISIFQQDGNRHIVPTYTISSANTWEHKVIQIPGDTGGTIDDNDGQGLSFYFLLGAGATYTAGAGANSAWAAYSTGNFAKGHTTDWAENNGATFLLTGVQFEVGDSASDFEFRSYPEELALCQRYCFVISDHTTPGYKYPMFDANAWNNGAINVCIQLPVTMRTSPTLSFNNGTGWYRFYRDNTNDPFDNLIADGSSNHTIDVQSNGGLSHTSAISGRLQMRMAGGAQAAINCSADY